MMGWKAFWGEPVPQATKTKNESHGVKTHMIECKTGEAGGVATFAHQPLVATETEAKVDDDVGWLLATRRWKEVFVPLPIGDYDGFTIANVYGDPQDDNQELFTRALARGVKQGGGPYLIVGDFNSSPERSLLLHGALQT